MQREEIWTEKYRPRKLKEVAGQEAIIKNLQSYVRERNLPHLIFSGPAGVGKTAAAVSMAREFYGDTWSENFTELNASDERGIEVVRTNIKNFARTMPIGNASFKIIFLDEADALTDAAQSALRRTMERYSGTCRFILSCNYSSKIIEPIQSRCSVYRFKSLSYDAIAARIQYIVDKEGLKVSEDVIRAINYVSMGDMRRAVNTLQSAAVLSSELKPEMIYEITATARPEEIKELIKEALNGKFFESLDKLEDLVDKGISGDEILAQMHRLVINMDIPAKKKVELMDQIGEADYRITEGAHEKIQLDALIASFCLASDKD
jgi:replication factor C small subunit